MGQRGEYAKHHEGKPVEIECEITAQRTAKALLIKIEGKDHWIPKSQIISEHPDDGFIVLSAWIVKQKGLA